jgi:hypothetical protein
LPRRKYTLHIDTNRPLGGVLAPHHCEAKAPVPWPFLKGDVLDGVALVSSAWQSTELGVVFTLKYTTNLDT